jgi:protein TonB
MKISRPLSWKTLTYSALVHGAVIATAGLVLVTPTQVGVQNSSVTAEFQVIDRPCEAPLPTAASTSPVSETAVEVPKAEVVPEVSAPLEPVPKVIPDPEPLPAAMTPAAPAAASITPSSRTRHSAHSSQQPPAVVKRGARDLPPDYLNNPPPLYPESSRLAREEGVVVIRVVVASSGSVSRSSVATSSGHSALDRAALAAVSHWKFRPAALSGCAMESEIAVPVRFELQ